MIPSFKILKLSSFLKGTMEHLQLFSNHFFEKTGFYYFIRLEKIET